MTGKEQWQRKPEEEAKHGTKRTGCVGSAFLKPYVPERSNRN
jgi:hypothetical protein